MNLGTIVEEFQEDVGDICLENVNWSFNVLGWLKVKDAMVTSGKTQYRMNVTQGDPSNTVFMQVWSDLGHLISWARN